MSERYEKVREELVARGYLQGRVERFVLRDLRSAAAPGMARTSVRAALVGAPLLGGLLAASTVAANRPVLGLRDGLVLWAYFAVAAGAALFLLDLAAARLAGAWARRRGARPSDALRAGLFVGAPVLAYLAVLWVRGRPERGAGADLLFLAGAVATTGLVAWLAGVVSLAGIVGRTGDVPDRMRRPALLIVLALVPVAAAVFLAGSAWRGGGGDARPPDPFAIPSPVERTVVLAIDGLDGSLVEDAAARGGVPRLLEAFARGAVYPTRRPAGIEPPQVWTTIATGMPVEAHGVRSAGATRLPGVGAPIAKSASAPALDAALRFLLPGRTVAASGASRRVRAIWEIAGLARPSAAVGWWASWPARGTDGDPKGGYVVSDRALARILAGAGDDHDTSPESLYARLARDFPDERDAMRRAFDPRFEALPENTRALAWESFLIDAFAWSTTMRLLDDPAVASAFVYLPGLDILRTRARSAASGIEAVDAYLRWLDEAVVGDLVARGFPHFSIVADPGRASGPEAEGFVAVAGGGASAACVGPTLGDLDVTPLLLRTLGLPVSREMPGRAPARCYEGAPEAPPSIGTWGRRGRPAAATLAADDEEMLQRLKSLGYLR